MCFLINMMYHICMIDIKMYIWVNYSDSISKLSSVKWSHIHKMYFLIFYKKSISNIIIISEYLRLVSIKKYKVTFFFVIVNFIWTFQHQICLLYLINIQYISDCQFNSTILLVKYANNFGLITNWTHISLSIFCFRFLVH